MNIRLKASIKSHFILFAVFSVVFFFATGPHVTRSDIANGIRGYQIRLIHPNMNIKAVISILGNPYQVTAGQLIHKIGCNGVRELDTVVSKDVGIQTLINNYYLDTNYCCDGNKEDKTLKSYTLTYTRPVTFFAHPMLWIHFDSTDNVSGIYAKHYSWLDPQVIYSWFAKSSSSSYDAKYINEALFNDVFN